MVPKPPPAGRAERVTVGCFLILLLALYSWASFYRTDALDEGYFIYTSSRVAAGDLPYRDFSTPYTPAFFYLNALLFRVFGMDLLTLRFSLVVVRLVLAFLLYRLGRRVMPPLFAALPIFCLVSLDQAPSVWESHPAWWATLWLVAAVWCVCRYREGASMRWWVGAALAAALSFAFKQNIGLFAVAALVGVALTEQEELPRIDGPSWIERSFMPITRRLGDGVVSWIGPLYLLALGAGVTWGMRQHLDPTLATLFVLPFVGLAFERTLAARRRRQPAVGRSGSLTATCVRLGLLACTVTGATLPWLAVLAAALGPRQVPWAAFVGGIDTGGYFEPLEPLRSELVSVLGIIASGLLLTWAWFRSWHRLTRIAVALGAIQLGLAAAWSLLRYAPDVHPRFVRAASLLSVKATGNLVLYLPSAAFWAAYACLFGPGAANRAFTLRWLLLAGSLLLLNQYPRMDETHMLFSGVLLWIAGAYGLSRLHDVATRELRLNLWGLIGRAAFLLALVTLPLAALWPSLEGRRADLLVRAAGAPLNLTTPTYTPLGIPGASVFDVETMAEKYTAIAGYLRAHTRPGDHIFVYPAAPLIYYLADRPNATRFNHLFPGLLTDDDERETVERLATKPAVYVIWDGFGATYWGKPGVYQTLTDYIWQQYESEAWFGGFEILRRKDLR